MIHEIKGSGTFTNKGVRYLYDTLMNKGVRYLYDTLRTWLEQSE